MKKRRNIIIIISIIAAIAMGIFMFSENSEFKQNLEKAQTNQERTLAKKQEVLKDSFITIFVGGAIYCIFYAIPKEYKLNQEQEKREKLNKEN